MEMEQQAPEQQAPEQQAPEQQAPEQQAPEQQAPEKGKKMPTPEELREEFMKILATPIGPEDHKDAKVQVLMCDIQIAELEQAAAQLEARVAANKAEIAKCMLAKAIIVRRLANK